MELVPVPTAHIFYGFPITVESLLHGISLYSKVKAEFAEKNKLGKRKRHLEWNIYEYLCRKPKSNSILLLDSPNIDNLEERLIPLFSDIFYETWVQLKLGKTCQTLALDSTIFVTVNDLSIIGDGCFMEIKIPRGEEEQRALLKAADVLSPGMIPGCYLASSTSK